MCPHRSGHVRVLSRLSAATGGVHPFDVCRLSRPGGLCPDSHGGRSAPRRAPPGSQAHGAAHGSAGGGGQGASCVRPPAAGRGRGHGNQKQGPGTACGGHKRGSVRSLSVCRCRSCAPSSPPFRTFSLHRCLTPLLRPLAFFRAAGWRRAAQSCGDLGRPRQPEAPPPRWGKH